MNLTRRGFLKVGAATAMIASTPKILTSLMEIDFEAQVNQNDWVTEFDSFYLVEVPDYKVFSRYEFDKSVVLKLGNGATAKELNIEGYVNLYYSENVGTFKDSLVTVENYKRLRNEVINVKNWNAKKILMLSGLSVQNQKENIKDNIGIKVEGV